MKMKHSLCFISLVFILNICAVAPYHFYSSNADVIISGTTYKGVKVYADMDQNGQLFQYPFFIEETEMYSTQSRYQICSQNKCNAYFMPYKIPKYNLQGLTVTTAGATNYYKYNDGGFLVELWAVPNSNPVRITKVRQSASGFDRTIIFHTMEWTTTKVLSAPSEASYPGCAAKIQCGSAMDIVLVIDTSGSISANDYKKEQQYVTSVVESFDVGELGVHIGFITFSTAANIRMTLSSNKQQLIDTINGTPRETGETNIGGGIYAGIEVFQTKGRLNVPRVMIVLTDGIANIPSPLITAGQYMSDAAAAAKGSPNNILIYAIGVGDGAQISQLERISSGPSYISTVENFDALSTTLQAILKTVCVGGDSNACSSTCTNTQFCGCGTCMCTNDESICGSRGTFNSVTCGCNCVGNWENGNGVGDCSVCPIRCSHSGYVPAGTCACVCPNSWTSESNCNDCPITCNDHQFVSNCEGCVCKNFWGGIDCMTCINKCENGGTVANLNTCSGCTCPAGSHYTSSSNCKTCDTSYCVNGKATSDCKSCDCTGTNYKGDTCSECKDNCNGHGTNNADCTCKCNGFYDPATRCATCISGWCKNGGTPSPDCSSCSCVAPWGGTQCNECKFQCKNGGWVEDKTACNKCKCPGFWTGATCDTCDATACGANGKPNENCNGCVCDTGFTGTKCDQCVANLCNGRGSAKSTCDGCNCNAFASGIFCDVCNDGACLNGGTMKSDCSKCTCVHGWTGNTCSDCTTANMAQMPAPCIENTLKDTCYNLFVPTDTTSNVGKACLNLNGYGEVVIKVTLTSGTRTKIRASFYTEAPSPVTNPSAYSTTSSNTLTTSYKFSQGSTYYSVIAVDFTQSSRNYVAYSSVKSGSFSYNTINVGTCNDCLCNIPCLNGRRNSACTQCNCTEQWSGSDCSQCVESNRDYCSQHGHLFKDTSVTPNTCSSCACDQYYKGSKCDQCDFTCQNGGWTNYPVCNECQCPEPWTGPDCSVCNDNVLCNDRGTESEGSSCTRCDCNEPWTGNNCQDCVIDCNERGSGHNEDCTKCTCNSPWSGDHCEQCSDNLLCKGRGTAVDPDTCDSCQCNYPWGGTTCDNCVYECNDNGTPNPNCDGCLCDGAYTVSTSCLECDTSNNCTFCSHHGEISNPDDGCDTCDCYDHWGGEHCEECTLECNIGQFNNDCTACECPGLYTPESQCTICPLDEVCINGGTPDDNCEMCICVNGWGGEDCSVCREDLSPCQHDSTLDRETCSCTCKDQWVGRLCDKCTDDPNICGINEDRGYLEEELNNEVICRCACVGYWSGTNCDECQLNPKYGDRKCSNIQEPRLYDCSCHCPQFYFDDETCDTCIITPDDCAHPKVTDYVNTDPKYCDCGECMGNYYGRDCSLCDIKSCPIGYAFNETDCTCYTVCGNDILSEGEECEVGLMEDKDKVCCTDCYFNDLGCDDNLACTFDDICIDGSCNGVNSIDFQMNQDRIPLSPGPIPDGAWSRWGISFQGIGTTPILYDTTLTDTPRTNLIFPNTNPRGGDQTFGLVVAQETATVGNSICIVMDEPMVFSIATLLGVKKAGTTVLFYCADENYSVYRLNTKVWTAPNGPGGVEYLPIPCGDHGVKRICYENLLDAAIGPLYTCGSSELPLGEIGDYVWSDFNRDNVQDQEEIGIHNSEVILYDSESNEISRTRTDADGKYLFPNLYAGDYFVEFQVFIGYRFSTPVNLPTPSKLYVGRTNVFTLAEGQSDLTRDAGLYYSGRIGDYVWYDRNQDGVQGDNSIEPTVPGVTVNLYYSDDRTKVIQTTTTNSAGRYIFDDLLVIKSVGKYYSYTIEVISPPNSKITTPFKGSSTIVDSNFDPITQFSDDIVLRPAIENRVDLTIDCGIYYCCGSIGDYVWYDTNANGIQDTAEVGVPDFNVALYWNGEPYDSTSTDSTGKYLFSGLPLVGTYNVHFSLPPSGYVFTKQNSGNSEDLDSDASASGVTGNVFLTKELPDIRYVDAGLIIGCRTPSDCAESTDKCLTASCVNNQCKYSQIITCPTSTDICTYYKCNSATGNCDLLPTGKSCDDKNFCTSDDKCTLEGCVGTPNSKNCNDGLVCTENDVCTAGVCKGRLPLNCANTQNQCTYSVCDESKGGCVEIDYPDNTPCDDGLRCTVGDTCQKGRCISGERVVCSLSDSCRTIACSEITGTCQTTYKTGATCNDRNSCTENDKCAPDGTCAGTPIVCSQVGVDQCHTSVCDNGSCKLVFQQKSCDDKNQCTENDACIPATQKCQGVPKTCPTGVCVRYSCNSLTGVCDTIPDDSLTCTDNDPCTIDKCTNGVCKSTPINCDDGNYCTFDECRAGQCVHINTYEPCNDGNPCTYADTCFNGFCEGTPMQCDDNEICTVDYCKNGKCVHDPAPGNTICDDNNFCTPSSYCVAGKCQGFDSVNCDDGDVCTDDMCDPILGKCVSTYNESPCEDGDLCTHNGVCSQGECISESINCIPDDNVCLAGSCVNGACRYDPKDGTCDDHNPCTENDVCQGGSCAGTPKVCVPIDVCHDAKCVNGECVQVENTAICDDQNSCTVNDVCRNGECHGTSVVCNDNNPCTDDRCNAAGFCEYVFNSAPCSDGNACTIGDVCSEGGCKPGSDTVECNDFNTCTADTCDPSTGECKYTSVDGDCSDNNGCTEDDKCVQGVCVGTPVKCTGDNFCLNYFCNPLIGQCESVPNNKVCNDNNLCTSFSSCLNGECVGVPIRCASNTTCRSYACNPANGICESTYLNGNICSDNNPCTINDVCTDGSCQGTPILCPKDDCVVDNDCTPSDKCHTASCVNNQCVSKPKICPGTDNTCTTRTCDLATGDCVVTNIPGDCDDGNKCTLRDICIEGKCTGLDTIVCESTAQCQIAFCNATTGSCVQRTISDNLTPCNDAFACTVNDVCTNRGCMGTPLVCNDNNRCTADTCVSGKCKFTPIQFAPCDDGNSCTKGDFCVDAACIPGTPVDCNDNNVCTSESCINGECSSVKLTGGSCDDNNKCTLVDECFNGECSGVPLVCDDYNPCTQDRCDPSTGSCIYDPIDGSSCDDSDPCTSDDICGGGVCKGSPHCPAKGTVVEQCVEYRCDATSGGCIKVYTEGRPCVADANCFKTEGICSPSGVCISEPIDCNSHNPCAIDSCDLATGQCVQTNNYVSCTPEALDACHTYKCIDMQCSPFDAKDCSDSNTCTRDYCENGECIHEPIEGYSCDDNNLCTTNDVCDKNGECSGVEIICDDHNECTTDTCSSGICIYTPNTNSCTSSNLCATESKCVDTVCKPLTFSTCTPLPCNDVSCESATGKCVYTPNDAKTCDDLDQDKCTRNFCMDGMCQHEEIICTPPAGKQCVESFCNPDNGACELKPNDDLPCDDFNLCTIDKCESGECVGTPFSCTDDNPCTYDGACDMNTGSCTSVPYSCHISPCLYYSCIGDGRCILDAVAPNYIPILYLSIRQTSGAYHLIALNATNTVAPPLYSNEVGPLFSIDVEPKTGTLYASIQSTRSSYNIVSYAKNSQSKLESIPTIIALDVPAALDISIHAEFASITSPYDYNIYALEPDNDKFIIYDLNGDILPDVVATPPDAYLISWDHYGRTAFYFQQSSNTLYLWQNSLSFPICTNVQFGRFANIISIDTAVDGNIFVGVNDPIAVFAITFQRYGDCPYSKLQLPSFLSNVHLLSLAVDNTYCPLLGASPSSTPSVTPSATPSPPVVVIPPTTTTGAAAQPGGNLGSAGGNAGVPAGQDTNLPLTGTSGYISTAVVGSIAGVAVFVAAIFGAVVGLNTTKDEKSVPLATVLDGSEVSGVTMENPTFLSPEGIHTSALS